VTLIRERSAVMRVALGACAIWAVWWTLNLVAGRLVVRGARWTDPMDALGFDFNHNYLASRCWLSGCNPYFDDFGDPRHRPFIYPPIVLFTFAWTPWLSMATAVRAWSVALMAMVVAGAIVAARERRRLGLRPIPYPVAVAALLWAAPTIFAIERGNYDVLAAALAAAAVFLLVRERVWADGLAGFCMATAGWLKLYPFILIQGLVAMRRSRCGCLRPGRSCPECRTTTTSSCCRLALSSCGQATSQGLFERCSSSRFCGGSRLPCGRGRGWWFNSCAKSPGSSPSDG